MPSAGIPPGARRSRARRFVYITFAVACLAVASGVVGASLVKSPAEVAAETAPPPPSVMTAPVVDKTLTESLILRGTFAARASVSFAPSSVASTQANAGGSKLVVTGMFVHPGQRVRAGEVVAEVSDRPVYVLPGALSLWRDLAPGESGKDVAELQAALADLGYSSGSDNYGYFGDGTEAAVEAFYHAIGYAVPVAPSASASAVSPPATAGKTGHAKAGPPAIVPMSEAWFLPKLPADVLAAPAHVGAVQPSSLLTVSDGGLRLVGQLDPSQSSAVKPGMRVAVYSNVTGYSGTGTVGAIRAEVIPAGASGGAYIPVSVRPLRPWPASLDGQNVELTITSVSTGHPVLAVPVAAVAYDAAGHAQVIVRGSRGVERRIHVTTGMSADGYVQVTSTSGGGALAGGMQVVVGQ